MAASWENFGRQIAAGQGAFAAGETAMGKALAEQIAAMNATRKTDAELAEMERTKQFRDPKFANKIAGALAGFTDPQTNELSTYIERGNWGPDMRFGPPAAEDMTTAPTPQWATPGALQRFNQARAAQMVGLGGKGDSNAEHFAKALDRFIGQGREDSALAGQITPEAAQGLNTYRAADAGKLYSFNEAGAGSQQTGVMVPNPVYAQVKAAEAGLKGAQAKTEVADAEKKRAEAAAARAKVVVGPDGNLVGARPKMTAAQEKETFEADDLTATGQNAAKMLRAALELNSKAYSGVGATLRAKVRSNLPGQSENADATVNLDNLMTGQALESLKATFGAAPTEGERKILLDMQASADKTPKQREDIIKRGIELAERRVTLNREKAKALRDGSYLRPGYEPPAPQADAPPAPKMTAEDVRASVLKARKAIEKNPSAKPQIIERLEKSGITDHGIL